ncbi:MAG: MMPL family transporter [Clostridia bacterium]|nr:MMPL family transporter [Clostridia bacterium]
MKKLPSFRSIMDKVGSGIVRFRVPIVIVIAVLVLFCAYGITRTNINSDIMSYLPEGTATYDGSSVLSEKFGIESNAVYAVKGSTVTYDDLAAAVNKAKTDPHVADVMWLGSMSSMSFGSMEIDDPFSLMEGGDKARAKYESLFYRDGTYMLMVTMDVGASTNEAGASLAAVNDALDEIGAEYVSGGTAPVSRKVYDDAISELPIYLAVAVVLVLMILFLVSSNWLEPVIFMATMGVSIVINMGTNFFFPEVSIITFCAASILQLALAMDYSIFLTQLYGEERAKGLPPRGAMIGAIGTTLNTVFSSALTTMGGFAAFFVMSFTLGADLAGVLIKGIALALVTVIVLQPCLLILLEQPMKKTGHRRLIDFKFRRVAKFSVRHRVVIVVIFSLLLVPTFIGQYLLPLSYMNFMPETKGDATLVACVQDTSNQIFLMAPVIEDDPTENIRFAEKLEAVDGVSAVTGFFAFLPPESVDDSGQFTVKVFGFSIHPDLLELGMDSGYVTEDGYTLYLVSLSEDRGVESEAAEETLLAVKQVTEDTFTGKTYFVTGVVQAVSDFRELTPRDFRWITLISIAVIFVVLLLSFRSFIYPCMLVLLIELGTWINFSISTIFGQSLNFLAYIVVGAIQLGATVDYAILVTHKYRALRREGKEPMIAAYESGTSCTMSVVTSASILIAACASVTLISSNAVIKEITLMVMRGATISAILVLFVLPSLLACRSRISQRAAEAGGMHALTLRFLHDLSIHTHDVTLLAKARLRARRHKLISEGERLEDMETRGLAILQPKKGYRFNSDSVILANLVKAEKGEVVYDLGCGSGVMGLLVAAKREVAVTGLELQPAFADMARRSVRINDYGERMQIVEGDMRRVGDYLPPATGDVAIMNPPYFKVGSGAVNPDESTAIARHEIAITIREALAATAYLLKEGGRAYVLFPTAREKEFDDALAAEGLSLAEKTYLTASRDKAPDRFIALAVKGAPRDEVITRTLVTRDTEGHMSKEVADLYRS